MISKLYYGYDQKTYRHFFFVFIFLISVVFIVYQTAKYHTFGYLPHIAIANVLLVLESARIVNIHQNTFGHIVKEYLIHSFIPVLQCIFIGVLNAHLSGRLMPPNAVENNSSCIPLSIRRKIYAWLCSDTKCSIFEISISRNCLTILIFHSHVLCVQRILLCVRRYVYVCMVWWLDANLFVPKLCAPQLFNNDTIMYTFFAQCSHKRVTAVPLLLLLIKKN